MKTLLSNLIISSSLFVPHDYQNLDEHYRGIISEKSYHDDIDWYNNLKDIEFLEVLYKSNGLAVKGIIGKPKITREKHPVIVYVRGGSNDTFKITVHTLKKLAFWVEQGYIVIATQYRGTDGTQGKDEMGGADLDDVLNSIQLANELDYADKDTIYMIGNSRGGMMALMALRHQPPIKAVALTSAVTDIFALETLRPDLIPLFNEIIPGMPATKQQAYTDRSPVLWADEINVPLLIIHGDADCVIDVSQSKRLAHELQKHNKEHKLVIIEGEDHFLANALDKVNQEIINWFKRY